MQIRRIATAIALAALLGGAIFYHAQAESRSTVFDDDPGSECRLALSIAESFLPKAGENPKDYKLIEAKNLLVSGQDCCNPNIWQLTFLDKKVIDEKGLSGKGGQLYVEVNVKTKEAKIRGHGE